MALGCRRLRLHGRRLGFTIRLLLMLVPLFTLAQCGDTGPAAERIEQELRRLDRMAFVWSPGRHEEPFLIDRFEVTNAEFGRFLRESGYRPTEKAAFLRQFSDVVRGVPREGLENHPVIFVSLEDAQAYAHWSGKQLPSSAQWKLVASGVSVGDRPLNRFYMNVRETGVGRTTRVGSFESGKTRSSSTIHPPVYDLLGNVWEWTATPSGVRSNLVCGGSFNDFFERTSAENNERREEPANRHFALGFRCVVRDATSLVESLLQDVADSDGETRETVFGALARFGEPMVRWIEAARFADATVRVLPVGKSESDRVFVTGPGQVTVVRADASVLTVDVDTGDELARIPSQGELYHLTTVDFDHDGFDEVVLSVRVDQLDQVDRIGQQKRSGHAVLRESDGTIVLEDLESGERAPWSDGIAGTEDMLIEVLVPDVQLRTATGPEFGEVRLLETHQKLICLDGRTLVPRWERITPYSDFMLSVGSDGSLLAVPGLWWIEREETADLHLLDLLLLDGTDGSTTSRLAVPGGCSSLAQLEAAPLRLGLVTLTGRLLNVRMDGADVTMRADHRVYETIQPGPAPAAASVSSRTNSTRPAGSSESSESSGQDLRIELLGHQGEVLSSCEVERASSFLSMQIVHAKARGILVQSQNGELSMLSQRDLASHLEKAWTLTGVDVDLRTLPALVDFDGSGGLELAAASGFAGIVFIDAATGRLRDRLVQPGGSLHGLYRVEGGAILLAAFRDRGLFVLKDRDTRSSRVLRDLEETLNQAPARVGRDL